jgi:cystathionine beta-lyase/cystathionine gamma-synthase
MQRHCENGEKIAHWLRKNPKVQTVYWCGFNDHPGFAIAKKQMRGFGGMISFELKNNSAEETKRVLSATRFSGRKFGWCRIADQPSGLYDTCIDTPGRKN